MAEFGRRLYESFNARNLSLKEVAQTFVPPNEFKEVLGAENVLVMGPRGSGKTTLFKMLTFEALERCGHPLTESVKHQTTAASVYIPTDRHWHHLLTDTLDEVREERERLQLSKAAVTVNVLYAVCETFEDIRDYSSGAELPTEAEEELVQTLSGSWGFEDIVPRLGAVKRALTDRLRQLDVIKNRLAAGAMSLDGNEDVPEFVWSEFLSAARVGCEAFEEFATGDGPQRWALCFDELELAPEWLQERVFEYLRSTDQRFVFKLSTAPIPELLAGSRAAAREDFEVVRLWRYGKSGDPYEFSERLARSVLEDEVGDMIDPVDAFGRSRFFVHDNGGSEYVQGSWLMKQMASLAEKDASFRDELRDHGVSLDDSAEFDKDTRDQFLRKAKPIALLRNFYLDEHDGEKSKLRSRKVHSLYSGREAIYDVADNNPRWLIGILNELKGHISVDEEGQVDGVERNKQARVLRDSAETFLSLLRTLPSARVRFRGQLLDLVDVLEAIGGYFEDVMLRREFTTDPAGSIEIDDDVPEAVRDLLQKAVYEGALVLVNPSEGAVDLTVESRRLRLTHLLAPVYRLPLRLYGKVRLSTCLRETRRPVGEPLQPDLKWGDSDGDR